MLKVERLTKTFELSLTDQMTIDPVKQISFRIPKGRFMGVAGPSGVGKSSILKCIYRTYLPTEGIVEYDSAAFGTIDLAQATERQIVYLRNTEIGYVTQFLKVIPRISATDVVAERLIPGYSRHEARLRAHEMLARLNIPPKLWEAFPATFSGGEQQRVNLARAFIARPRLLILDEPTASLDADTKTKVLDILHEMKQDGCTMIGVFHDSEIMAQVADEVLDLQKKGKLA